MTIETHIPNAKLRQWCEDNAEKIEGIGLWPGFSDDKGGECFKYDLCLADGWHFNDGESHKLAIERNGNLLLRRLRNCVERCPKDCDGGTLPKMIRA